MYWYPSPCQVCLAFLEQSSLNDCSPSHSLLRTSPSPSVRLLLFLMQAIRTHPHRHTCMHAHGSLWFESINQYQSQTFNLQVNSACCPTLDKKLSQNETCCQEWTKDCLTTAWCALYVAVATALMIRSQVGFYLCVLEWTSTLGRCLCPCSHTWILPLCIAAEALSGNMHISLLSRSHPSKLAVTCLSTWAPGWGIYPGLVTVGPGASRLLCTDRLPDNSHSHTQEHMYA